jgi:hypothetical protein
MSTARQNAEFPVGTNAEFAGLSVRIIAHYDASPYPTTLVEYCTANRETVPTDALYILDPTEPGLFRWLDIPDTSDHYPSTENSPGF